jgi:hypothetical protein
MNGDASVNPPPTAPGSEQDRERVKENPWLNLVFNAVLPGILLTYLSKPERLGPIPGLLVSLSLPIAYGAYDLIRRRHWNTFSIVGLAGISLTGGLELLKVDPFWFAVKEAVIPSVIGLAIPLTLKSSQPLVKSLLYNDQVLNTKRIEAALDERGKRPEFEDLLRWSSWGLAISFIISGGLNFCLSKWLVTAPANTPERIAQLGKLHLWNWPVVFLPSVAMMMWILFRLVRKLEEMTGLTGDDLFHPPKKPAPKS